MKKYIFIFLSLVIPASLFLQRCIKHPSDGITEDSIIVYSSQTITEAVSNDGTFDETITATVSGNEFVSSLSSGVEYETVDLPTGLTADVTVVSPTVASIHISGQATSHSFCTDQQMSFNFTTKAFANGERPISFDIPITIVYFTPTLTFSATTVDEDSVNNDGTIPASFTITASAGGQFEHGGSPAVANDVLVQGVEYTWANVPAGFSPFLQADATNPTTVLHVSLVGPADSSSPTSDVTAELQFLTGVSSTFCAKEKAKDIKFKFVRTVVMYAVDAPNGNLQGRTGADQRCYINRPTDLPSDYVNFSAFISVDGTHQISDIPSNYGVPTNEFIESESGLNIALDWTALLSGTVLNTQSDADTGAATYYWTGSDSSGNLAVGKTCSGWTSPAALGVGGVGTNAALDGTWLSDTSVGGLAAEACNLTDHSILCLAYTN